MRDVLCASAVKSWRPKRSANLQLCAQRSDLFNRRINKFGLGEVTNFPVEPRNREFREGADRRPLCVCEKHCATDRVEVLLKGPVHSHRSDGNTCSRGGWFA